MRHSILVGLLAIPLSGALSACDRSCKDADRVYEDGQSWTCSDGCNNCTCQDGDILSTAKACPEPPGPNANKLDCVGREGRSMRHGASWTCADGMCCTCDDGDAEQRAAPCPMP